MTSAIRRQLASDMVIMTKIIARNIRLFRMFMQYVRRLISCPVVRLPATIMCPPIQLIRRMQLYTTAVISGLFQESFSSALTNIR